jgi:hypothetical protein
MVRPQGRDHEKAFRVPEEPSRGGSTQPAVENDPPVETVPGSPESPRQKGVVRDHRPRSDENCVVLLPEKQSAAARLAPGDPATLARTGRGLAVEGRGPLGENERPPPRDPESELLVLPLRSAAEFASGLDDLDAGATKGGDAAAGDQRVCVPRRQKDAPDTRLDDPRRARRRPAGMDARLERQVQVGAARAGPGAIERCGLGVRASRAPMPRLRDDPTAPRDDRAHHRVRRNRVPAALREIERARQERVLPILHAGELSGASSETASPRSARE